MRDVPAVLEAAPPPEMPAEAASPHVPSKFLIPLPNCPAAMAPEIEKVAGSPL
jgi:hypothetical protein